MAQLAAEAGDLTVVMHCYSLPQYVDECNERGYYASFAGNVTYKNAAELREAAAKVRDDRLLVETDAPFLAPVPNRGNSNVPAWVAHTAALVAEVRGVPAAELAALTTANARRVFGARRRRTDVGARRRARRAAGDRSRPPRPHALRRYGQNHLVDKNILHAIVDQAAAGPDDVVLEVGAAGGLLTRPMLERARLVHAFEIDRRWLPRLEELAAADPRLVLHAGDALKADLAALDPPPTALVANLAYNIAIPLIMTTIAELPSVRRWAVMVQRELGERLFAVPLDQGLRGRLGAHAAGLPAREGAAGARLRVPPAPARGVELRHLRAPRGRGATARTTRRCPATAPRTRRPGRRSTRRSRTWCAWRSGSAARRSSTRSAAPPTPASR